MTSNIYRFRVSIQDLPLLEFLLHIFVQHDQPPRYLDLLNKIKQHSKTDINNIHDYYMIIEKQHVFKYKFKDDLGLQNAFKSITDQDKLEIKLMKKIDDSNNNNSFLTNNIVPLVKPIFIRRRPSHIEIAEEEVYYNQQPIRKDTRISFEQEIEEFKKEEETIKTTASRKLPALSHIITTQLWSTAASLPSPPPAGCHSNKSPIKLPGLSSIIIDHSNYQQKQLAPIYAYHPVRFDQKPLSPPLSASSPSSPYNNNSPTRSTNKKRTREGTSHQSQFICEHVIDTLTGKTCCQAFRRSYDLSRHQTIHLKNRPFCYCHDCGKKFTRLDALRRHERIQGHNNNK